MAVRKKPTKGKRWRNFENEALVRGIREMKIPRNRPPHKKTILWTKLSQFVPTRTPDQCKPRLQNLEERYDRAVAQASGSPNSDDDDLEEDLPSYLRELFALWNAPPGVLTPGSDDDHVSSESENWLDGMEYLPALGPEEDVFGGLSDEDLDAVLPSPDEIVNAVFV